MLEVKIFLVVVEIWLAKNQACGEPYEGQPEKLAPLLYCVINLEKDNKIKHGEIHETQNMVQKHNYWRM